MTPLVRRTAVGRLNGDFASGSNFTVPRAAIPSAGIERRRWGSGVGVAPPTAVPVITGCAVRVRPAIGPGDRYGSCRRTVARTGGPRAHSSATDGRRDDPPRRWLIRLPVSCATTTLDDDARAQRTRISSTRGKFRENRRSPVIANASALTNWKDEKRT